MKRELPNVFWKDEDLNDILELMSCSTLSLLCGIKDLKNGLAKLPTPEDYKEGISLYSEGYRKLKDMDKSIRFFFPRVCYHFIAKSKRGTFKDYEEFFKNTNAIVCVEEHYFYVNNDTYYSYFDNDNDKVVAFWLIYKE